MSTETPAAAPKKGGKLKKIIMLGVGAGVLAGGGVAAGMYATGGSGAHKPIEDPNRPKLVPKKDGEGHSAASDEGDGGHGAAHGGGKDMSGYEASYYPIEGNFTSNLRDSEGIVQLGIGVSTYYDSRIGDNMKKDEMPIKSAVLMTLADQDAFAITTPEGKKALQKALKDAINQVLVQKEGFGGIDDVYFTSFIIQ